MGTRVHIERKESGGQIKIDFFSTEDLRYILDLINKSSEIKNPEEMLENHIIKLENQIEENKKMKFLYLEIFYFLPKI